MHHLALFIQHDEHGEAEATAVVQSLHQCSGLLFFLCSARSAGVVVHMDILEVLVDDTADGGVVRDEISKAQAPGTPVAAYLTDDELAVGLGLEDGLVNLLKGVDIFVIYLLQRRLRLNDN